MEEKWVHKTLTKELCRECSGNGVVKIPGGVSVCNRCDGDCFESVPSSAVGASLPVPRYDLVTNYRCGSSIEEMERNDENGDWLHWEDALAMSDRIRLEHDEWDKRCVAELQDLRLRHHELKAALLALETEMEQLVVHWTTCEDGIHGLDPMPVSKREQWGDHGWVKWSEIKKLVAHLRQLRER